MRAVLVIAVLIEWLAGIGWLTGSVSETGRRKDGAR